MDYIIKNKRLANYLYCLGFVYKKIPNKYDSTKHVYAFPNTELLQEAIKFYDVFKKKLY